MDEEHGSVHLAAADAEHAYVLLAGFEGLLRLQAISERQLHLVSGFRGYAREGEDLSVTLAKIAQQLTGTFREQWGDV